MKNRKTMANALTAFSTLMVGAPFIIAAFAVPEHRNLLLLIGILVPIVFAVISFLYLRIWRSGRTKDMNQVAAKFGNPVDSPETGESGIPTASFERSSTIFTMKMYQSRQYSTEIAAFDFPQAADEKFFIQD